MFSQNPGSDLQGRASPDHAADRSSLLPFPSAHILVWPSDGAWDSVHNSHLHTVCSLYLPFLTSAPADLPLTQGEGSLPSGRLCGKGFFVPLFILQSRGRVLIIESNIC